MTELLTPRTIHEFEVAGAIILLLLAVIVILEMRDLPKDLE